MKRQAVLRWALYLAALWVLCFCIDWLFQAYSPHGSKTPIRYAFVHTSIFVVIWVSFNLHMSWRRGEWLDWLN